MATWSWMTKIGNCWDEAQIVEFDRKLAFLLWEWSTTHLNSIGVPYRKLPKNAWETIQKQIEKYAVTIDPQLQTYGSTSKLPIQSLKSWYMKIKSAQKLLNEEKLMQIMQDHMRNRNILLQEITKLEWRQLGQQMKAFDQINPNKPWQSPMHLQEEYQKLLKKNVKKKRLHKYIVFDKRLQIMYATNNKANPMNTNKNFNNNKANPMNINKHDNNSNNNNSNNNNFNNNKANPMNTNKNFNNNKANPM
eukprot:530980_1